MTVITCFFPNTVNIAQWRRTRVGRICGAGRI